jgi:hypothetical protein
MHRARGPPWATEKFCGESHVAEGTPPGSDGVVDARAEAGDVLVRLGSDTHVLSHAEARRLRERLGDALVRRDEFYHMAGEHRPDGSHVVARRRADSSGHHRMFDSLRALERPWERLPERFTAEDLGVTGLSGGHRHMVLRHLVEHPAFDCELVSRQPLTALKRNADAEVDP